MKRFPVFGLAAMAAVVAAAPAGVDASPRSLLRTGVTGTNPGYEVVVGETPVNGNSPKQLRVSCPAGKRAVGAGWGALDQTGVILEGQATYSEPGYDGSNWLINAVNRSAYAPQWKLRVRVICVSA